MEDLLCYCGEGASVTSAITVPAMQLEAIMLSDAYLQRRYAEIYGMPWQSLLDTLAPFDEDEQAWFRSPVAEGTYGIGGSL